MTKKILDLALIRYRLSRTISHPWTRDSILAALAGSFCRTIPDGRINEPRPEEVVTSGDFQFILHAKEDMEDILEAVEERDQIIHDLMLDKDMIQHGVLPPQQAMHKMVEMLDVLFMIRRGAYEAIRSDEERKLRDSLHGIVILANEYLCPKNDEKMEIHGIPVTRLDPDQVEVLNSIQSMDLTPEPEKSTNVTLPDWSPGHDYD